MTVSLKHTFQSAKTDSTDVTIIQPSNWNQEHELTLATNKLLGRATAGTGAAEELSVGTALSVSGGTLAVTTVLAANGGTGLTSSGASGNVLTSNGTTWTSAVPPGGAWTQIATTTISSPVANVTFSSIPQTYNDVLLLFNGVSHTSAFSTQLAVLSSSDNGTTINSAFTVFVGESTAASASVHGGFLVTGYKNLYGVVSAGAADFGSDYGFGTTASSGRSVPFRLAAALNWLRVENSNADNLDAGTITLLGR